MLRLHSCWHPYMRILAHVKLASAKWQAPSSAPCTVTRAAPARRARVRRAPHQRVAVKHALQRMAAKPPRCLHPSSLWEARRVLAAHDTQLKRHCVRSMARTERLLRCVFRCWLCTHPAASTTQFGADRDHRCCRTSARHADRAPRVRGGRRRSCCRERWLARHGRRDG